MKKYAPTLAECKVGRVRNDRNIRLGAWIAACLAAPSMLLATPAFSASFDCSKGGSANEKIICNDPQLSAMDDKLGKTFKQARKKAADRRAFNTASDKQWRWREQNCSNRECLVDWYRQRQSELEAVLADPPSASTNTSTSDKPVVAPAIAANPATAAPPKPAMPAQPEPDNAAQAAAQRAARLAPVVAAAEATTPTPAPVTATATSSAAVKPTSTLRLQLTSAQIAGIAPKGASPRAHYLSAKKGEYLYADPDAPEQAHATVSVRYLGIEHGQHILEARRKDVYIRYTCSADCAMIGQLQLPGDAETDMVFVKNDHKSLPSLIVTDALNGLLLESVVVR